MIPEGEKQAGTSPHGPLPKQSTPDETLALGLGAAIPATAAHQPMAIGRYRLIRLLGQGGMGSVFEAQQAQPRRIVALKVIRPGFASPSLLRRFELESQVLGLLQHQGIAQIFEAGTEDAGFGPQPYFAMELVRGRPLLEHVREAGLVPRQRMALVARICDAVHHAHQKGVIHRDLKPGNILVDESGQPKILDFGVARAVDSDLRATMQTDAGSIVGTLPYMSPEQVSGDPDKLDTRSDVFALGVILYEILSGRLPHDFEHVSLPDVVRALQETESPRLGTAAPEFRGDVETIVAKALSKEKSRRYQSAAELGADIRRYLNDEPIAARPPSTAYQLMKFARRNRPLVAGTLAVLIVTLVGGVVSGWLAIRARRAESLARTRLEEARRGEAKAEAVSSFLEEMLSSVDPSKLHGREVTVRESIDEAVETLDSGSLADEPAVEASVRATIGRTFRALGLLSNARPHLARALEARRAEFGSSHPDVATSVSDYARLLYDEGDYEAAEPFYREALETRLRVLGPSHALVARSLDDLAGLYYTRNELAPAESLYRAALAIRRAEGPDSERHMGESLGNLASLLYARGELAAAESLFRESLVIEERVLGPGHPDVVALTNNLATVLTVEGKRAAAESLYVEMLATQVDRLGPEHPLFLMARHNLASLLTFRGEYRTADSVFRECIEIKRRVLGAEHPDVGLSLNGLAQVREALGDLSGAEQANREALRIRRASLGDAHPLTAESWNNLALVLYARGDLEGAETGARQALTIRSQAQGDDHLGVAIVRSNLATILLEAHKFQEADLLLRANLSILEKSLGPSHRQCLENRSLLGTAIAGLGETAAAESLLVGSYELMGKDSLVSVSKKEMARERVVDFYSRTGKSDAAELWRRKRSG